MKKLKYQFVAIAFTSLFIGLIPFSVIATELNLGDQAPNLIGNDALNDSRINLYREMAKMNLKRDSKGELITDENGKFINEFEKYGVVLNFFARTCIPCLKEVPTFNKVAQKYRDQQIKLFYVNVDYDLNTEQARKLVDTYSIKIPMMMVNQNEAIRKYNADRLPRLVVVDKDKKVRKIITGFDEQLESKLSALLEELIRE